MEGKEKQFTLRVPEPLWWRLAEATPKLRKRSVNALIVQWLTEKADEFEANQEAVPDAHPPPA